MDLVKAADLNSRHKPSSQELIILTKLKKWMSIWAISYRKQQKSLAYKESLEGYCVVDHGSYLTPIGTARETSKHVERYNQS